jgi:outer membrane protein assembly factor BamA
MPGRRAISICAGPNGTLSVVLPVYIFPARGYDTGHDREPDVMNRSASPLAALLAIGLLLPCPAASKDATGAEKDPYKARLIAIPFIYYSPETKLAFGGGGVFNFRTGRHKDEARTSSVWAYASYNLARQFNILIKPEIFLQRNNLFVHGNIRYERAPQRFYGVGNDMPSAAVESYTPRILWVQVGLKKRILGRLFVGPQFDFEQTTMEKVESGGILDAGDIIGSRGGVLSGFGLSLDWDTRDTVLFPRKGVYVQFTADTYGAMAGSDFSFNRLVLDYRRYVPVGDERVLAIQAYIFSAGGDVPFHRLALLGGESLLRGYYKGRFRDKGLVAVQAEYRVIVTNRIGIAGFAGLADVFPGFGDFKLEKLKFSVGTGLRYVVNKRDGTRLRLDMAWGQACFGLYLTAKEAF